MLMMKNKAMVLCLCASAYKGDCQHYMTDLFAEGEPRCKFLRPVEYLQPVKLIGATMVGRPLAGVCTCDIARKNTDVVNGSLITPEMFAY